MIEIKVNQFAEPIPNPSLNSLTMPHNLPYLFVIHSRIPPRIILYKLHQYPIVNIVLFLNKAYNQIA